MTDLYAVFGNPISQTKSPYIHSLFATQSGQQLQYQAILGDLENFEQQVKQFFANGGKGCNVTVPFKERAFAMADRVSERAKLAGAANTLKLLHDGGLLADNTDGAGLVADLELNHVDLKDANVLLIGAGGAARGVIKPLIDAGIKTLTLCNRTVTKAKTLAEHFSEIAEIQVVELQHQPSQPYDLIINSTSASLERRLPGIDTSLIHAKVAVYDMVYGRKPTVFMEWAQANGALRVQDGLGMLVAQAAESFAIWRGLRPGVRKVLRELRRSAQGIG